MTGLSSLGCFFFFFFLNNINILRTLIEYSNEKEITLNINQINMDGEYPLLSVVPNRNLELVQLLIDYCNLKKKKKI